jgi:hypothetical protein
MMPGGALGVMNGDNHGENLYKFGYETLQLLTLGVQCLTWESFGVAEKHFSDCRVLSLSSLHFESAALNVQGVSYHDILYLRVAHQ